MRPRRGSILTEPRFATTLQLFYLADNGVTVLCPQAEVGDTGEVNGVLYTKRDRQGLYALRDAVDEADLVTSCTSGVTDMASLFRVRVPRPCLLLQRGCVVVIPCPLDSILPLTPLDHPSLAVESSCL